MEKVETLPNKSNEIYINNATNEDFIEIDWENYNYPKLIKVIHFELNEIKNVELKKIILRMNIVFILITIISFINNVNALTISATQIYPLITYMYSCFNLIIFSSFSFITFYIGYRSMVGANEETKLKLVYIIFQVVNCFLWITFSVIDVGAFNGFIRISRLTKLGTPPAIFCIILATVESFGYISASGLGFYCIWAVHTVII